MDPTTFDFGGTKQATTEARPNLTDPHSQNLERNT